MSTICKDRLQNVNLMFVPLIGFLQVGRQVVVSGERRFLAVECESSSAILTRKGLDGLSLVNFATTQPCEQPERKPVDHIFINSLSNVNEIE